MSRIVVAVLKPGFTTLSRPDFSAMKMRPSGAHAAVVGIVSPPTIVSSSKPEG